MKPQQDYGVRILHASGATGLSNREGTIIFPPGVLRERLLRGKLVEEVLPPGKTSPVKRAV